MSSSHSDRSALPNRAPRSTNGSTQGESPSKKSGRKRTEESVRFQSLLLDAVGQAVIATDQQGKIVYWNRAAEELYGWSAEEAAGRSVLEVALPEQTPGQR